MGGADFSVSEKTPQRGEGSQRFPILWVPFCFEGSASSAPQRAVLQRSSIVGLRSVYVYTLCCSTQCDVVINTCREGVYVEVSTPPFQESGVFQRSPIFGVLYLCLYPLTLNDQIRHGNTHGEGRVVRSAKAIAFARTGLAVCQRQLSFLFYSNLYIYG